MSATESPFAAGPRPSSIGADAMNTGQRPHPAAPRIPLIVPIVVLFAAIFGVVYALAPFFGGRPDGFLTAALGAPLTALFLLATVALTSWWFLTGEVRQARSALLALALVLLPLAGMLATIQGVEAVERRWGGVAGRNLAWFMLRILETSPVVAGIFYGALLAFGLYFLRVALAAAASPADASAILARLARGRSGTDGAVAEITLPSADEALGLPRPVAADRDLFAPDAEVLSMPISGTDDESTPETAFLSAPEDDSPVAIEEPPPPPRRRRVLEDIVSEEEFAAEERAEDSTIVTTLPEIGGRSDVALHEVFGHGVIDAEDDEDVLTPPAKSEAVAVATEPATPPSETDAEADDEDDVGIPEPLSALLDQAAARLPHGLPVEDDRESVTDTVEAAAEREEERPLFAPPPRLLPFEDDDVGDVDDLPTDDDASARKLPLPFTDAATAEAEPEAAAESFDFDARTPTPPPARYDADIEGSRTGEAPQRALRDATESSPSDAVTGESTESGLFTDTESSTDAAPAPAKRKRTRTRARTSAVDQDESVTSAENSTDAEDAEASFRVVGDVPVAVNDSAPEPEARRIAAREAEVAPEPARLEPATTAVAAAPARSRRPEAAAPLDDFEILVSRATEVVVAAERCSPSLLQRELGIRFVEAAAVIERLHQRGIVGPHTPSGVREVFGREGAAGA